VISSAMFEHKIHHPFCGRPAFARSAGAGKDVAKIYIINVRCFEGVEL